MVNRSQTVLAAALVALLFAATACSAGDGGTTTTGASNGPKVSTTTLPESTTSTPTATSTPPTTSTTTTDGDATSTTSVPGEAPVVAPTDVLSSFTGTSLIEVDFGTEAFVVDSFGTHVDGSYDCTTAVALAGAEFTARVISTPEGAWIDDGSGFVEAEPFAVVDATAGCPADPSFWSDFSFEAFPKEALGFPDEVNGVPAQRYDLLDFIEVSTELGLAPEIEGADYEEFSLWLADDGDWLARMVMRATLTDQAAADAFGLPIQPDADGATLLLTIDVTDADDPALEITTP